MHPEVPKCISNIINFMDQLSKSMCQVNMFNKLYVTKLKATH